MQTYTNSLFLCFARARRYLVFLFLAVSRFICSAENWFLNRNLSCTNQTYINISNLQYAMTMAMATAINITATVYTYVRQSGRTKQKYTHRNRINYNNRIDSEKFFVVVVVVADFTWIINFYRFSRSLSFCRNRLPSPLTLMWPIGAQFIQFLNWASLSHFFFISFHFFSLDFLSSLFLSLLDFYNIFFVGFCFILSPAHI